MKQLKFRWWNGQRMIKHKDIQVSVRNLKNMENMMQFTGLLDKEGTEIYEGDIVNEPISPVGGADGGYLYKSKIIKWHVNGYKLYNPQAASEVIGNIYEPPDLINNQTQ